MKKTFYIALSLLFCANGVSAQQIVTLQECRDMAVENNVKSEIANQKIEKADYTMRSYKANFFPKFSAGGEYLYSDTQFNASLPGGFLPTFVSDPTTGGLVPNFMLDPTTHKPVIGKDGKPVFNEYAFMPATDLEVDVKSVFSAQVYVEQPIYMGGKISAAYSLSKIGKTVAEFQKKLTESEVIINSDEAYWTYVKTLQMKVVAEKYKDVLVELSRNVSNGVEAGMVQRKDLLKVQVKLNEAELNLRRATNGVRLASMNLCHIIGLPLLTEIAVSSDFIATNVSLKESYDLSLRPEYQMMESQIEAMKQKERLAQSDFLPNLGVMAGYGYTNGLVLNDNQKLLDGGSFSAMVSLKIPIFHWGEGNNKVRSAKTDSFIAELQLEDAEKMMTLEINKAINALDEAGFEVELTQKSLNQAKENLEVSKNQYDVGMETLANYLEAQASWQKAYSDNIDAMAQFCMSQSKYLKAIGQL